MSQTTTSLNELAALVGGTLAGDGAMVVHGAAVLSDVAAGQITMVDQPERIKQLALTQAVAVVVPVGVACDRPAIAVADVHAAFAKIVCHFRPPRVRSVVGISQKAYVSLSARLEQGVSVYPGATIGDDCRIGAGATILPGTHLMAGCTIGRDVTIGPGAVLYENTVVGDRSIIHAGVVLGTHGFGYSQSDGRHVPTPQLGHVEIGADVEIGAGTTIDRGTYGPTTIGDGTKIDNQVQIAHNCRIGRHNMICSQVGIAGSTTTGDYVVMAGQVGVRDHVHIGTGAMLGAMAGITNDVPDGAVMMGIPATPEREQKLKQAALAKLPEMRKEFKQLRQAVAALEKLTAETRRRAIANRSRLPDHDPSTTPPQFDPEDRHVGLLAAWGRYPIVVAEALKRAGLPRHLPGRGAPCRSGAPRNLRRLHLDRAGQARPGDSLLPSPWRSPGHDGRQDPQSAHVPAAGLVAALARLEIHQDVLRLFPHPQAGPQRRHAAGRVGRRVRRRGHRVSSCHRLCSGATRETRTDRRPPAHFGSQQADIEFGWDMAKQMGGLDIGQSVCVKDRAVLAVEAIEGTDACIRRAGELCRQGGFTVVKVCQAAARHAVRRAHRRSPHAADDGRGGRHACWPSKADAPSCSTTKNFDNSPTTISCRSWPCGPRRSPRSPPSRPLCSSLCGAV